MDSEARSPQPPLTDDDVLPPVDPPTAGFILQLFLIPLIIVTIIVLIWLLFSWLANMGNDPEDMVRDLQRLNKDSWRKAYTLSNLLRNPEHDALKDNSALSRELASTLSVENEAASSDMYRVRLRVFLCRALGEFRVADGLPALVAACRQADDPAQMDVRYAALEAMAVLAGNAGAQIVRSDPDAMEAMLVASRETDDQGSAGRHAELRSTAAFALGVVGGQAALERLSQMLDDPHPNARYNAATGLARHGDPRAIQTLLEMLDTQNESAVAGERTDTLREVKRNLVLANGIQAAVQLREQIDPRAAAPLEHLREAMEGLAGDASVPQRIRLDAKEALYEWNGG